MVYSGSLRKMLARHDESSGEVSYELNLDGDSVSSLNKWIGRDVSMTFEGKIHCTQCGRSIKKTYNDGFCYPCLTTLPQGDICMMKPELCHFHDGTCRDSEWGKQHCFIPHTLYLARSSGIKVGISREVNPKVRWMDQGASEAMAIGIFPSRLEVGLAEVAISSRMSDKTNWRKMLTNDVTDKPLTEYLELAKSQMRADQRQYLVQRPESTMFRYPVEAYPVKVKSFRLDSVPHYKKRLTGIKGQYLLLDSNQVFNVRKHTGYLIELTCKN